MSPYQATFRLVINDQWITLGYKIKIEKVHRRLVTYYDSESQRTFQFITSNKRLSALKIAMLYKQRWQIEMLFKRLKQNMPLEYFLGENENAIKIQIWCSLIAEMKQGLKKPIFVSRVRLQLEATTFSKRSNDNKLKILQ